MSDIKEESLSVNLLWSSQSPPWWEARFNQTSFQLQVKCLTPNAPTNQSWPSWCNDNLNSIAMFVFTHDAFPNAQPTQWWHEAGWHKTDTRVDDTGLTQGWMTQDWHEGGWHRTDTRVDETGLTRWWMTQDWHEGGWHKTDTRLDDTRLTIYS